MNISNDHSFLVVFADHTRQFINTKKDTINLQNKNVTIFLPRTLSTLCTYTLNISYNKLRFLPPINSLRILKCNNCGLKELPPINNLQELNCANNLLTTLPIYKNAVNINCSNNFITFIDFKKYLKLKKIDCSCNLLTDIPILKTTVISVNCPVTTVYYNPAGFRRSGVIKNGKFTWIVDNTKYTLINWQTSTTKLIPRTEYATKLFRFLFNA
jgi:hypothetical protein